jgi:hypothetical protein
LNDLNESKRRKTHCHEKYTLDIRNNVRLLSSLDTSLVAKRKEVHQMLKNTLTRSCVYLPTYMEPPTTQRLKPRQNTSDAKLMWRKEWNDGNCESSNIRIPKMMINS